MAGAAGISLCAWWICTPFGGHTLLRFVDNAHPRSSFDACPGADAVVVLSGDGPPRLRGHRQAPLRRSEAGLLLVEAGKAPWLVFTDGGWEGDQSRAVAIRDGVSDSAVEVVGPAWNTDDEAHLIIRSAVAHGWRRLILVTSGYHITRSRKLMAACAREIGARIEITDFVADSGKFFSKLEPLREYSPSGLGLGLTLRAARELAGGLGI